MSTPFNNFRFSISVDFMKEFGALPRERQKSAREFLLKFQRDPRSSGINYEKIQNALDPSLRSVRVDKDYRAIVSRPSENVFILLGIAKHDDAYRWAASRRLEIHPTTGALQIVKIEETTRYVEPETPRRVGLFDQFQDDELLRLGVPSALLPRVRAIDSESALDEAEPDLPPDAYERLFLLACGASLDEALNERANDASAPIPDSDDARYCAALDAPEVADQFKTFSDDLELLRALNEPLETWRVYIHPDQLYLANREFNGPVRVLGSAGTGKTVAAVHRTKYLATEVYTGPTDRILFTTFTKNLAADAQSLLESICPPDAMKRIDVINLDAWAARYLRKQGYGTRLDLDKVKELWEQALGLKPADCPFSDQFFKDEWRQIVQPQNVTTLDAYLKAPRLGRGRRLNRKERRDVWTVFEEFRALKTAEKVSEFEDVYNDAYNLLADEENRSFSYRAIVVDEAQDLSLLAYKMLRRMIPEGKNDLFLVGDSRQRIYGYKSALSAANIDIRGRGKKLRVNYRTTRETYQFASNLLRDLPFDNLDDGDDPADRCLSKSSGPEPTVSMFRDREKEQAHIVEKLRSFEADQIDLRTVCVVCRTNNLRDDYARYLDAAGIECEIVENERSYHNEAPGVRLATTHRVKGLEFDYVIVASVCQGIVPMQTVLDAQDTDASRLMEEKKERSLLYVALTRARKAAFITGYGKPSPFLEPPSAQE